MLPFFEIGMKTDLFQSCGQCSAKSSLGQLFAIKRTFCAKSENEKAHSLVWSGIESKDFGWPRTAHGGCYIFKHLLLIYFIQLARVIIKWHLLNYTKPIFLNTFIKITIILLHIALCFNLFNDLIMAANTIISVNVTNVIEHVLNS